MVYLEYTNFDDIYKNLTRLPVKDFKKIENDSFIIGASVYVNNMIIKATSFDCHLDMADFNYTRMKWTRIINLYIDQDQYRILRNRLETATSKTLTFNFKVHQHPINEDGDAEGKDGCLVQLVFSRNGNKGSWTTVNVFYRVQEIYKKFAIDLILLNRMFNDLPNLDLREILFHIPQPFYSTFILNELIGNLFDISEFQVPDNFIQFKINKFYQRFYSDGQELSSYHQIARKQIMKRNGVRLPSIPIESLTIFDLYKENLFEGEN